MDSHFNRVFFPASFNELFLTWDRFPAAILYAGGTNINLNQIQNKSPIYLCLDKIAELHSVTRTEQYLEIGAMTKLNTLLRLGKTVPNVICKCLENIAGVQLRNLATIGGNICAASRLLDLPAALAALDAQYELRNVQNSRWVSAVRFHSKIEDAGIKNQELLSRIRLPLYQWDYAYFKKFYKEGLYSGETLVFLAKTHKNLLSEIRVVYKSGEILRDKDGETILNGKSLPLNRKTADEFVESWKDFLSKRQDVTEFARNSLLQCIEENVYNLSE
jgi:CO/xanthine dehydrogenase FAD-binding subunit